MEYLNIVVKARPIINKISKKICSGDSKLNEKEILFLESLNQLINDFYE